MKIYATLFALLFTFTANAGTINVQGVGTQYEEPDQAFVTAGILTKSQDLKEAVTQNNEIMKNIFKALKSESLGLKDHEIKTNIFSMRPVQKYVNGNTVQDGYQVNNNITVTVCDFSQIENVIGTLIENGANTINGVNFAISNVKELNKKARVDALVDATEKARLYCETAGLTLLKPKSISEGYVMSKRLHYNEESPVGRSALEAPISGGEQNVSIVVNVVFETKVKDLPPMHSDPNLGTNPEVNDKENRKIFE